MNKELAIELARQNLSMALENIVEQGYFDLLTGQGAEFIGRTPDRMLFKTPHGNFIAVTLRRGNGEDEIEFIAKGE